MRDTEQQSRRMLFNVVARNQDDHVKNIAFLMDKAGKWSLSAAFDITYAYNPEGAWTARHQMTLNGKTDGFTPSDFRDCARVAGLKQGRDTEILAEVVSAVQNWPRYADAAGITARQRDASSEFWQAQNPGKTSRKVQHTDPLLQPPASRQIR